MSPLAVHLNAAEELERQLREVRRMVAADLKAARQDTGLSLRQVGRKVRLTPAALMALENGESWKGTTARRVARFYERLAVPAAA
jgi:ribosome-binding protein aMBF1 (putative translation factor)